jgi:hypothetical protein
VHVFRAAAVTHSAPSLRMQAQAVPRPGAAAACGGVRRAVQGRAGRPPQRAAPAALGQAQVAAHPPPRAARGAPCKLDVLVPGWLALSARSPTDRQAFETLLVNVHYCCHVPGAGQLRVTHLCRRPASSVCQLRRAPQRTSVRTGRRGCWRAAAGRCRSSGPWSCSPRRRRRRPTAPPSRRCEGYFGQ